MTNLIETAKQFLNSNDFVDAVVSSTMAGWNGGWYSVEVFEDGTWRVLWNNQIGNSYVSPGMIVALPQLSPEQGSEVDEETTFQDVVRFYFEELADEFLGHLDYACELEFNSVF